MELTINDAVFTNNEANLLGGGVAIGYDVYNMEDSAHREHIQATINKATFNGNKVLKNYLDVAGGGLFISQKGHVYMKNAAIFRNSTEGAGGGIADCVVGETYLKFRNGAAIFSNSSEFNNSTDAPSENVKDVYLMGQLSNSTGYDLDEKMFNGGQHNWTYKEPVSITYLGLDDEGEIIIKIGDGSFWGSTPSDTNTEGAQVLFYGNEAHT